MSLDEVEDSVIQWRIPCCLGLMDFSWWKKQTTKPESLVHLLLIWYWFLLCLPTSNYKSKSQCYCSTASLRREEILAIPDMYSNTWMGKEETDPTAMWRLGTCDGAKCLIKASDVSLQQHTLQFGIFRMHIRKNFCTRRAVWHWNYIAQRSHETPSFAVFRIQLDKAMSDLE